MQCLYFLVRIVSSLWFCSILTLNYKSPVSEDECPKIVNFTVFDLCDFPNSWDNCKHIEKKAPTSRFSTKKINHRECLRFRSYCYVWNFIWNHFFEWYNSDKLRYWHPIMILRSEFAQNIWSCRILRKHCLNEFEFLLRI